MKTFEKIVLYLMMMVFIALLLAVSFSKFGIELPIEVDGNIIIGAFMLTSIFGFLVPTWDIGKYLGTMEISKINEYKRMYRLPFLLLAFSFFGLIGLASSNKGLEIIGVIMVVFGIIWFIYFYIMQRRRYK